MHVYPLTQYGPISLGCRPKESSVPHPTNQKRYLLPQHGVKAILARFNEHSRSSTVKQQRRYTGRAGCDNLSLCTCPTNCKCKMIGKTLSKARALCLQCIVQTADTLHIIMSIKKRKLVLPKLKFAWYRFFIYRIFITPFLRICVTSYTRCSSTKDRPTSTQFKVFLFLLR